jgi:hypothetical protein
MAITACPLVLVVTAIAWLAASPMGGYSLIQLMHTKTDARTVTVLRPLRSLVSMRRADLIIGIIMHRFSYRINLGKVQR